MDCNTFCKKYYVERKGTDCIKWDREDVKNKLPMFIADMDFRTEDKIIEGMKAKMDHGAFGYAVLPKDYYETVIAWNKKRNKVTLKKEWFAFSKGAVDGIFQIIYALTKPNDSILITTPVYPPFSASVTKTKRKLVTSKLINKDGLYTFDYKDIEKKIVEKKVKMIILCTPHNPIGRVWTKDELAKLFKITHKHHVLVLSDEVHADLIMPGHKFVQSLSFKEYQDDIISLMAASKTFSLAVYANCHVVIPNKKLKAKFDAYQELNHLSSPNIINAYPTYLGYKYGEKWLEDCINVIYENYKYFVSRLGDKLEILPLEGTYLMFVNFKGYCKNAYKFLDEKCGIIPNAGETFAKGYETWARLNIATSLDNVKLACDKIEKALKK